MEFQNLHVVVSRASEHFGRAIAVGFAHLGAHVYASALTDTAAENAAGELVGNAADRLTGFRCDPNVPADVREFARAVGRRTDRVDLLVNCAARPPYAVGLGAHGDTGEVLAHEPELLVRHFLPLLRRSRRPDIVQLVSDASSGSGPAGDTGTEAGEIGRVLPPEVRVFSLYPPRLPEGETAPETLTMRAVFDCVGYAVEQPRDRFVRSFHFQPDSARQGTSRRISV